MAGRQADRADALRHVSRVDRHSCSASRILCAARHRRPGAASRRSPLFMMPTIVNTPRLRRVGAVLILAFAAYSSAASAQQLAPIRYTVSFPAAGTHYLDVEATIP